MGLIRITGGAEGLKEYLERGEKKGRYHTRDQLDERVVLAGDLELTDSLIKAMSTQGDRFLHITFSLKEDSVPLETLQGIVDDFEQFAFSAFGKDEYNFYAEAHLPKIKSVSDEFLGSDIVRLPHIHIVVPKVNLLTGETLNPFGWTARCIKHIDAFQEVTNHKYGLASPKENRRNGFFERTEIVGRMSGTEFSGRSEQLKFKILRSILERKIRSMDDFRALLKESGQMTSRNHGQAKEVCSVKPDGSKKSIELLDSVFTPAFIQLPNEEKKSFLVAHFGAKDLGEAQPDARLDDALMGFRKSITSSQEQRKDLKKEICTAIVARDITTVEAFRQFLKEFGTARTRNAGRDNEYENVKPPGNTKGINLTDYEFSRAFIELPLSLKKEHIAKQSCQKYETAGEARTPPNELLTILDDWKKTRSREIKYLNSGNRAHWENYQKASPEIKGEILSRRESAFARRLELLRRAEQDHISENVKDVSIARNTEISRPSDSRFSGNREGGVGHPVGLDSAIDSSLSYPQSGGENQFLRDAASSGLHGRRVRPGTGRRSDSVVGQLVRDLSERTKIAAGAENVHMDEIKAQLDAVALLNQLSKTHGLITEKYAVTRWPDGSHRIKCGNRNYPVNDFLTKEMHLPWLDAQAILQGAYAKQRQNRREKAARKQPNRALWDEFQKIYPIPDAMKREEERGLQRESESRRWLAISDRYHAEKLELHRDGSIGKVGRKARLSILKMSTLGLENALRKQILIERQQIRDRHRRLSMKDYREWLIKVAENDERALDEFRRINVDLLEQVSAKLKISGNPQRSPIAESVGYEYRIHSSGDVTYHRDGVCAFSDTEKAVLLFETTDEDIETALRLAILKFGYRLEVSGDPELQYRVAEIAAEENLHVVFDDPVLNEIKQSRLEEIAAERVRVPLTDRADDLKSSSIGSLVVSVGAVRTAYQKENTDLAEKGREPLRPVLKQGVDETYPADEAESNNQADDESPKRPKI